MKRKYRTVLALVLLICIVFMNTGMDGRAVANVKNPYTGVVPFNECEELTDNGEEIEEDITVEDSEECLYTVAEFISYASTCKTLTTENSVDSVEIDTDKVTVSGKVLVLGEEGDSLPLAVLQQGMTSIYVGSKLPEGLSFEYTDDIEPINDLNEYDIIIFDENCGDVTLSDETFLILAQLLDTIFLYDSALLFEYCTSDGGFYFDKVTGVLLINTTDTFIGTETYYTGTYTQYRTLTFDKVTSDMVKIIKFLPTYPTSILNIGLGGNCLAVNTSAEEIVLPGCITSIKSGFSELNTLRIINLEKVINIDDRAFKDCTFLEEVDLSDALCIGKEAFKNDARLQVTKFNDSVQLSESAFENGCCGKIVLPQNLKEIPAMCFQGSKVSELVINSNLQSIGIGAFYQCPLSKITIPENVTYIAASAFAYSSLVFIDFQVGTGTLSINDKAFSNCTELSHVNFVLKDKKSWISLPKTAFVDSAEKATYKVSCRLNDSKNQVFQGAYNHPQQPYKVNSLSLDDVFIKYNGYISFDANGGTVRECAVVYGSSYGTLPIPVRNGYNFLGWYNGESQIQEGDSVNLLGDTVLVAKWEAVTSEDVTGAIEVAYESAEQQTVTTNETLKNEPIYYRNYLLETTFATDNKLNDNYKSYESEINHFSYLDKINAERLFNEIYTTSSSYKTVILNPEGVNLKGKKYNKYKIISTGLDTDSFIRAISLMNIIYFQNLNYMHKMKNDFLTTNNKLVYSYNDLLAGITSTNCKIAWRTKTLENVYTDYRVADFEAESIDDEQLHYTIDIGVFKEYRNYCEILDKELDEAAVEMGLNNDTCNITITDAAYRINEYLYSNYAYDHFYKTWDLYWFVQPKSTQNSEIKELLEYYYTNEGDKKRDHHGICQSYAFFACAMFARYGYAAPGYYGCNEDGIPVHIFNHFLIDGQALYVDYCWNADTGGYVTDRRYMFLNYDSLNTIESHRNSYISPYFQKIIDFNGDYSMITLEKGKITRVKKSKGRKAIVQYKKIKKAEQYQIQYSVNKRFSEAKSVKAKGNKVTIKKLKKKTTYYFRVRAYCSTTYMKNIKVYGKWSKVKKLKIPK